MDKVKFYRKKPVVIWAMQYAGDFYGEAPAFYEPVSGELYIKTLEGNLIVSDKDYVIKGIAGEFYPCKPEIFENSYEVVE